ncbi:MAG TPA: hypothetical protein VFB38_19715 [Chthonomonadaceae bacterium]|nr:hypothetical protein [Chthonomonadaceae bacterium]
MNITFTRTGECTYTTQALRDDAVLLEVPSYDRTHAIPHDLAHYVVERELGLKRGFWGCVAAGALFPGIKVISGRQPDHTAARSQAVIREAGQQGTEAEVLVGVLLRILEEGLENNWPAARALLREAWKPSKPSRGPLEAEEMRRVCAALCQAQQRWQALAVGESMTVSWRLDKRAKR